MNDEHLDLTLSALADPTRRAILQRLSRGHARVTDLAEPFPISLNSVSKHIQILETAGLVSRSRQGREHIISLVPAPLDDALDWLEINRDIWTRRLDRLEAQLQVRRNNEP